jgi:tRNA-dihydrouridine synthase C
MKIYLAPMEGLADFFLRKLISAQGGYDLVVTEFIRVVDQRLPKRVFVEAVPELLNGSRTEAGTPVRIQLLGNHPSALAENALRACELGSFGIDLNFGCPSKTVNSSKGGAVLLDEPETIYQIIKAVRTALPINFPLSAKMRLGYNDESRTEECAWAIRDGGANEIVIHARTKKQGYTPPAHWHKVANYEQKLGIPLIINGEIWDAEDATLAMATSKCRAVMLGRGAVQNPFLAQQIKANAQTTNWNQIEPLVMDFWEEVKTTMSARYSAGRLKQWLKHLKQQHSEAEQMFLRIRELSRPDEIDQAISIKTD